MRALETAREDALVHDPWAAALAGHELVASFADQPSETRERAASYTIVRTLAFDDWLRSVQQRPQMVLLGAGFDTRAFRFDWPATSLWELDQPEVLERKAAILREAKASARCARIPVAADLASNEWPRSLDATGFRRGVPTVWLAEGLFPYLEPDVVDRLLHNISTLSAPGSQLAADLVSAQMMAARNAYAATLAQRNGASGNATFRFGADDPVEIFALHGWRVTGIKHPGDADCGYGRWLGPAPASAGFSFVFAERSI